MLLQGRTASFNVAVESRDRVAEAKPVTFVVPAGWIVDHDRASFQQVTFQRSDPVPHCGSRAITSVDTALNDDGTFAVNVGASAESVRPATTTWDVAERTCRVPVAAVVASAIANAHDAQTQGAFAQALESLPDRAGNRSQGYTAFHAKLARQVADGSQAALSPAVVAANAALVEPELWSGALKDTVASAATLGTYAHPAPGVGGDDAVVSSRDVLSTFARHGFTVLRDLGVRNGVDMDELEAMKLPLGKRYAARAAPAEDPTERLDSRLRATMALTNSLFGVVRNCHYGAWTTWGDSEIVEGAAARKLVEAEAPAGADQPKHLDTAYVKVGIGLHTDSTYYAEAPLLQVFGAFHRCPETSSGGESEMADGFAVAELLRGEDRRLYEALAAVPVVTTYNKEGRVFTGTRPVLAVDPVTKGVAQVSYNPYDRSPLAAGIVGAAELDRFYVAYARFGQLAAANAARFQLEVGDVLLFNNTRMLHSRTAYSGPRIMGGAYVGADDAASAVLAAAAAE